MDTSHGEGADLVRCSIELLNQREFVTQLVLLMERAGAGRSSAPSFTGAGGAGDQTVSSPHGHKCSSLLTHNYSSLLPHQCSSLLPQAVAQCLAPPPRQSAPCARSATGSS